VLYNEPNRTEPHISSVIVVFNHLNAELNPISDLLALLGAHHILHVDRIRVNTVTVQTHITM